VNVLTGANAKIIELEALGIIDSLASNFIASAKACKDPNKPTTLGPRRRCTAPKNLRSYTVKKATANNSGKIENKNFNQAIPAKKSKYITDIFIEKSGKKMVKNHFKTKNNKDLNLTNII